MINTINYDSDETYCAEGEIFIKNQGNIKKQDEDMKLKLLETEGKKRHLEFTPGKIKKGIEKIKKSLNSWFETNNGLPKYVLNGYISDLKIFQNIAKKKIYQEHNYRLQLKWIEINQVTEKLQDLIESVIKKDEINCTPQIEESQSLESDEVIIENISETNSQNITNNDQINFEDWTNEKDSEPPCKIRRVDNEISQNIHINEKKDHLFISNDSIENILPEFPKSPKKLIKKRNINKRKKNNTSIYINEEFINDNVIKCIQNENNFSQIDNNETFSETNKEHNSLPEMRTNSENNKNLEAKPSKYTKMITLSQLSRPSSEQSSEISQNNHISDKVFYEFWQHDENEFLNHENLHLNPWQNGGKIPEEFYKDLEWEH